MSETKELEDAVKKLPPMELRRFRKWFLQFDCEAWDTQLEDDVSSGKLDSLASLALKDHKQGKTTGL